MKLQKNPQIKSPDNHIIILQDIITQKNSILSDVVVLYFQRILVKKVILLVMCSNEGQLIST